MNDTRRFDSIERVVRDQRRKLDDVSSTVLARLATHTHPGGAGGAVDSVNGQTGVVLLDAVDVGAQPVDGDLTTIAGLMPTNGDLMQRVAGAWTNRTIAQVRTDLGLATVATTGAYGDLTGAPNAYTDEQVRDVVGAALVAGSNVTITPNDVGDTITIAATAAGGVTDHGALTGLADNDHPQYALTAHVHSNVESFTGVGSARIAAQETSVTRTSSTAFVATDLTFTGLINGARYALEGYLVVQAGTTGDAAIGWGQLNVLGYHSLYSIDATSTVPTGARSQAVTSNFATVTVGGTGANIGIPVRGSVLVSGGAGILGVQFAQATSNATASILQAGSWLRVTRTT